MVLAMHYSKSIFFISFLLILIISGCPPHPYRHIKFTENKKVFKKTILNDKANITIKGDVRDSSLLKLHISCDDKGNQIVKEEDINHFNFTTLRLFIEIKYKPISSDFSYHPDAIHVLINDREMTKDTSIEEHISKTGYRELSYFSLDTKDMIEYYNTNNKRVPFQFKVILDDFMYYGNDEVIFDTIIAYGY